MTNNEIYKQVFTEVFATTAVETLSYHQSDLWDSVGHLQLIEALESAFALTLEPADMMALRSYAAGRRLLEAHYHIRF